MNDLMGMLALPATWTGIDAAGIVHSLAETLRGMLALDLVYISRDAMSDASAIEEALASARLEASSNLSMDWAFSIVRLGLGGDLGVIVAAANRPDFPNAHDSLLLNVAANQAAVALLGERRRIEDALRERVLDAQGVIDGIPGMVVVMRPDGVIETTNRRNLDYLGTTLEDMRNWGTNGIVHSEDLPHVRSAFAAAIGTGVPFQFEQRVRRHDGVYRWFDSRGVPVRDAPGRVARWYILLTDIEDRKRAEALLAGEKQLLEMIASGRSLRDVLNALCKVVEGVAPECYCDIHPIDWSGPNIAYAVAPSLPRSYTDPIAGTPLRAEVVPCGVAANENVQVISEDFDTDPRWCTAPVRNHVLDHGLRSVWSTPICSKKGKVLGTLCIYQRKRAIPSQHHQDIIGRATHIASIAIERLEAEDALNKVRSDLAHVTRVMSLGTLAASIAHEVNQPLSGIITNANTCQRMLAADPPNVDGALETARRTIRDGNRAAEVVTRLRALFRKTEFAAEQVDVHEAAREVIALSHQEFRRQRVTIQTEFDDTTAVVTGDRVQLQQVILNFLLNGADALKGITGRERRIIVKTTVGDDVEFSVRDNGVGLHPEHATKVFDAFFTTKADGMGIGLSVSKSIIERHGGRIRAEQNEDGGATFSFDLPLREART
jgi:hypothetical protein